eukprot:1418898-Ditylum_brightwellii.AAC.1
MPPTTIKRSIQRLQWKGVLRHNNTCSQCTTRNKSGMPGKSKHSSGKDIKRTGVPPDNSKRSIRTLQQAHRQKSRIWNGTRRKGLPRKVDLGG